MHGAPIENVKDYNGKLLAEPDWQAMVDLEEETGGDLKFIEENGRVIEIDATDNQLRTFPGSFSNLTALKKLIVRFNELETLPPEIGNLVALKELNVGSNQLTALPAEIGNLTALENLDVRFNKLETLPREIGNLVALKVLDARYNELETLPPEIGNLVALKELNVSWNRLTTLPPGISNLPALRPVEVSETQVASLPESMGRLRIIRSSWEEGGFRRIVQEPIPVPADATLCDLCHGQAVKVVVSSSFLRGFLNYCRRCYLRSKRPYVFTTRDPPHVEASTWLRERYHAFVNGKMEATHVPLLLRMIIDQQRPELSEWMPEGSWCVAREPDMESDCRVSFIDMPTLHASSILALALLDYPDEASQVPGVVDALHKALRFLARRNFHGHGFNRTDTELEWVDILHDGRIIDHVNDHPDECKEIRETMLRKRAEFQHRLDTRDDDYHYAYTLALSRLALLQDTSNGEKDERDNQ